MIKKSQQAWYETSVDAGRQDLLVLIKVYKLLQKSKMSLGHLCVPAIGRLAGHLSSLASEKY